MKQAILTLNAGSSSLKFSAFSFELSKHLEPLLKGQIEGIGTTPRFSVQTHSGEILAATDWPVAEVATPDDCFEKLVAWLKANNAGFSLAAVGHRVVHGGTFFATPVIINDTVMQQLTTLIPLAPLHQPHNLAAIRAVTHINPALPQVACFDTAFHRTQPQLAELFALPYDYYEQGIRRYGFHGLSYEYIASQLMSLAPQLATGRVIVAHLGNGASMCAMQAGKSVATTMGFTALDGLPMGTRCGNIDPGVLIHCMRELGLSPDALENLLYKQSGLLGLSGISNDMRTLLSSDSPRAALAIDYFTYRAACAVGSLITTLAGLDALIFTAGIGENSTAIRARICARLAWLGIDIDETANAENQLCITKPSSSISVWVVPTNEEYIIARHTINMLQKSSA